MPSFSAPFFSSHSPPKASQNMDDSAIACIIEAHDGKNNFSLERIIRELSAAKDFDRIKRIIQQLCNDYAYAVHQPHARNGGLIGLAAAAIVRFSQT